MTEVEVTEILTIERTNTDHSLGAERDKTNKSLNEARKKTEHTTDQVVQAERHLADEITLKTRTKTDSQREVSRKAKGLAVDSTRDANYILDERKRADLAVDTERSRIDAALDVEREQKDAIIQNFLQEERQSTDKNLSAERTQTDNQVSIAVGRLSAEVAEHLRTRTSLTTRDEFLAIVSHDLKNPVGAAASCAGMLLDDEQFQTMDPELRSWLKLIKRNSDKALRLISDLLDMERIAGGKLEISKQKNEISEILAEAVETSSLAASEKSIFLRIVPAGIKGLVCCDRDRTLQILTNLISNALKFTPEGGSVTLNANFKQDEVQISVRDTGIGIPDGEQVKIFNRLAQIGASNRSGLGLGLHISKMLVEAHKGRIWVQSKPGLGSTFFFTLPQLS